MYLNTIEIHNFRSLKYLLVQLRPGLNVMVGRNNTGKTNLLSAIRHALGPSASRGESLWLDRDDFYRDSENDETERTISVTLTFSCLSEAQRAHFYEIVAFNLTDLPESKAIIRFEASWPKGRRQASIKRTGGPPIVDAPEVPTRILECLPITFLPALRDAEASLAPGYRSRLALLLRDLADRKDDSAKLKIEEIYKKANVDLEAEPLITDTKSSLQTTTQELAGSDHAAASIKAAPVNFDKILRTLQVQMDGVPIGGLDANGLGYNNLLYMAVVLEHLKTPDPEESPLFLVEEPEAHLHPQLTLLLSDYLANKTPGPTTPQTIVTTHSPTLAANIPPERIHVLFADRSTCHTCCNSLATSGMDNREQAELQRMMDITRATLYFAKAAILVEGISESLLIPVLAKRLGHDLGKLHISVIPICGVAFGTFQKLLNPNSLRIPVAIVTDGDPPVLKTISWEDAMPEKENGIFKLSDRTKKLSTIFPDEHPTVRVKASKVTLEYDLAEAGAQNPLVMAEVWECCFDGNPGTLNQKRLVGKTPEEKTLAVWRGICQASHSGSKAEFAHRLASRLNESESDGKFKTEFAVPAYLTDAIEHVVNALKPAESSSKGTGK